jgi:hypothetical protein
VRLEFPSAPALPFQPRAARIAPATTRQCTLTHWHPHLPQVFCLCVYFFGQRTEIARRDAERCARFKTQVLNCLIWGLFLVYPQVSSTTLLMFACTPLEGGTEWLMADYRCGARSLD